MKITIINGPNLNLLHLRESIYGKTSLGEVQEYTEKQLEGDVQVDWFQFNEEGRIINKIHDCIVDEKCEGLIINPGGYSHSSVAISDALKIFKKPKIEVHLSNLFNREDFRKKLLTAQAVDSFLCGMGKECYIIAIKLLKKRYEDVQNSRL